MRRHGRKSETMKTLKLKACPFCGSEANQPEDVSVPKYGPWWQVMCSNEQCRAWRPGASPAKAAAEWNKRAGDRQPATPDEAKGIVPFASASGYAAALEYATRLAKGMWERDWKEESPHWQPFDDLLGVLTQIDNMLAGMEKKKRHKTKLCDLRNEN